MTLTGCQHDPDQLPFAFLAACPAFSFAADPAAQAMLRLASDDDKGRRLAQALLLEAVYDANAGDLGARLWLGGDYACRLAEAVGLRQWPPTPDQVASASNRELRRRARELNEEPETTSLRGMAAVTMRRSRERRGGAELAG